MKLQSEYLGVRYMKWSVLKSVIHTYCLVFQVLDQLGPKSAVMFTPKLTRQDLLIIYSS